MLARGREAAIHFRFPRPDAIGVQLMSFFDGIAVGLLILVRQLVVVKIFCLGWLRRQCSKLFRLALAWTPQIRPVGPPPSEVPGTFQLVRIIGNDLDPLHDADQSINNLRFILEYEQLFPGCEKRWLLNRITDHELLCRLTALLESHGCGYDVIPFEVEALRQAAWDWAVLPSPGFLLSSAYRWLPAKQQQSCLLALYRNKNNALMNCNGARNLVLELARQRRGKELPRWILPWDGNCFLTPLAWQQICRVVHANPDAHYFHVPMHRVQKNEQLLDSNFIPNPKDEPQLIFSSSAKEFFNPDFVYGRNSKIELFWRLGLAGPWDGRPDEPWDPRRRPQLRPRPVCPRAGWVARLQAKVDRLVSQPSLQYSDRSLATRRRFLNRQKAIQSAILKRLTSDPQAWDRPALRDQWELPLKDDNSLRALDQGADSSATLLRNWLHGWDHGGRAPTVKAHQLAHALLQVVWQSSSTARRHGHRPVLSQQSIERLISLWFGSGTQGIRPRLRHRRCRPLAGRLLGMGPGPAELIFLALLSDLLVWIRQHSHDVDQFAQPIMTFGQWRSTLVPGVHRRLETLSLGWGSADRRRLLVAMALLSRHEGGLVDSASCLLPLVGADFVASQPGEAAGDPALTDLIFLLGCQAGLLNPPLLPQPCARAPLGLMSLLLPAVGAVRQP